MHARLIHGQYARLPWLIAVMTVVVLVIGVLAARYVENILVASKGESLALAAAEIAHKLDLLLAERYSETRELARAQVFRGRDVAAQSAYLATLKNTHPIYLWLGVTDAGGRIVAASDPASVGQDRSRSSWFQAARRTGTVHVSDAQLFEETGGTDAISFTAPIEGVDGTFQGVVTTRAGLPLLENVVARTLRTFQSRQESGGHLEYKFVTAKGDVFVDSDLLHKGNLNLKRQELPSALLSESGQPGFVEEENLQRHVCVITGYARTTDAGMFPGLQWTVLLRSDKDDLVAPIRSVLWKLAAAWILVWLPMFGFLFWSTTRLRKEQAQTHEERAHAAAAEANYRLLVEQARDVIYRTDAQGRFTFVNPTASRIMGYFEQELLGRRFVELIRPDAREAAERFYGRQLVRKTPSTYYEFPALTKNGEEIWFGQNVQVLLENGQVAGFHAVARDITERKWAEEAIHLAKEFSEGIIHSSMDGILAFDRHCRYTVWNPGMERISGVSKEQTLGKCAFVVFPFLKTTGEDKYFLDTLAGKTVVATDRPYVVPETGRQGFFEGHYSPLYGKLGEVTGGLVIVRDITERKRAEQALQKSQRRYKELVLSVDGIVWEADANTFKFSFVSPQAERILGYPIERWLTESNFWTDHVYREDREWVTDFCMRATREKKDHEFQYRMTAADDRLVWLHDFVTVVVENDQPVKLRGFMVDITERKREEKILQALLEGTASVTGEQFFPALVRALAGALGVRHAFVTELLGDERPRLRILVIWSGDRLGNPAEYDLARTPCENVIKLGEAYYQHSVQELFPEDKDLVAFGAVGYLGIALTDSSGKTIGHLCILDDRPLPDEHRLTPLLKVFASRAAAELERKRVDEALRESEMQMRLFMEATTDCIWNWDVAAARVTRNVGFERLFGYAAEDIAPTIDWWAERLHPDDRERVWARYEDAVASGRTTCSYEYRFRRRDGSYAVVNDHVFIVRDGTGKVVRALGAMTDITNRKRAEEQLTHSRDLLKSFVEHTPAAVAMLDKNLRYVAVSRRWLRDYHLGDQDLIGRHHYDVFPEIRGMKEWQEIHRRCLAGTVERREEDRFVRDDGNEDWLRWEVRPWHDEAGDIGGIIMFTEDITERKRAEEDQKRLVGELAESRNRFEMFFRQTPSAISITTVKDGRFLDVNKQAELLTGYSREELIGHTTLGMNLYVAPADRAGIVQKLNKTGLLTDLERQIRTKSGEIRTAVFSLVPIQMGSEPCLLSIAHDITERKRAESLLAGEKHILEMISSDATLSTVLESIVRLVEEQRPGMLCSILLLDTSGKTLRHGVAPSLPPSYVQAVDGIAIGPTAGSCGTAAFLEKPVIVSDISSDPLWATCRALALPHGLQACWSTPIFSSDKLVLGTFAQYHQVPKSPTAADLHLVERFCDLAGIAIERARAEEVLRTANQALRTLSRQLLQVQEEDRRAIARDLHDEIGQSLTAIKLNVERAQRTSDHAARDRIMKDCVQITDSVLNQVRNLSLDLHPSILDDLGLGYALKWYADRQAERAGLKVEVTADPSGPRLPQDIEIACFRIAQEALTNVVRHAQASRASVTLKRGATNVELSILDDGIGFVMNEVSWTAGGVDSVGLTSMQERAKLLGGAVKITSVLGQGTAVIAMVPLPLTSTVDTPTKEVSRS